MKRNELKGIRIELDVENGIDFISTLYHIKSTNSNLPSKLISQGYFLIQEYIGKAIPYFGFTKEYFDNVPYYNFHYSIANPYFSARYCFEKVWGDRMPDSEFINEKDLKMLLNDDECTRYRYREFLKYCNNDIKKIVELLRKVYIDIKILLYINKSFIILNNSVNEKEIFNDFIFDKEVDLYINRQ